METASFGQPPFISTVLSALFIGGLVWGSLACGNSRQGSSSQNGTGGTGPGSGGVTGTTSSGDVSGSGGVTSLGGSSETGGVTSTTSGRGTAGSTTGSAGSVGGTAGAGGVTARTGGTRGSGGLTGSGGATSVAGAIGTAGISSSGGAGTGAAGARSATGGTSGTGGAGGTGGAARSGGAPGSGGAAGGGGSTGTGGVTAGGSSGSAPYKGVANSPAAQLAALGATWCYNWGISPESSDCADPLFVPMIWGTKSDVTTAFKAVQKAGYKTVLGFNEPNKSDQANMTVDQAIALWPTLTADPNIRVGSPAVSDDGRSWLESFMTEVKAQGLRVDFIAMHWYGWNSGSCTASQLEGAVNWASKWSLPVWITEFGCMGSSDPDDQTVLKFFNDAVAMLKKHAQVERYAWYPWNDHNHLYSADANNVQVMTDLGKAFAAAPQYK